jgi:mannose-6-phosphate isomerase class I
MKMRTSSYDLRPSVAVPGYGDSAVAEGWNEIALRLGELKPGKRVLAVECYPGVDVGTVAAELSRRLQPSGIFDSREVFKSSAEIDALVAPDLGGDDPVFGRWTRLRLEDFLDSTRAADLRGHLEDWSGTGTGLALVVGPAASLLAPSGAVLVYADMPRWEGQLRQRRGEADNLGVQNRGLKPSLQYKRSFFIDWRVADRRKRETIAQWDYLLDTTEARSPKLVTGEALRAGLEEATRRPFRVVPFFDPGPWGGQWMRGKFGLDSAPPNFAWGFDCVPEENSLLLDFGGRQVEVPAQNLVFAQTERLLGEPVQARFGAEFPIRFDFLDTIGGGNLSFQVHPDAEFAREHFGLWYTQDESYYMLAAEPGASVYLGCRDGVDPAEMMADLEAAQRGEKPFDADRFAARFPARAHDHFLIPAGTLHCSGAGAMVLEISATPYIFTFKLWDWGRMGLDGKPRPVNLERGSRVIRWERNASYAKARLINQVRELARGDGWREERTGLHESEFIETRRHWFTQKTDHHTGGIGCGGVQVLNLVQGEAAVVESPDGAFAPFRVNYAETFIVPAAVGPYTIRPLGDPRTESATVKAFVRTA